MRKYIHSFNSFFYDGGWKTPLSICGYVIICGWLFRSDIHQLIHNILTSQELANKLADSIATIVGILCIIFKDQILKKDKKDDNT